MTRTVGDLSPREVCEVWRAGVSQRKELLTPHLPVLLASFSASLQERERKVLELYAGKTKRKGYYSGKKKRHTLKTQVTTSRSGLLLHVSRAIAGKVNDLTLLRGSGVLRELPAHLPVRLDRGYDGVIHDHPERRFQMSHKARRDRPLDLIQRWANELQNRYRVPVENALAHLKRFKLLAGIYRGPAQSYDDTFLAISGLYNFRKLGSLAW